MLWPPPTPVTVSAAASFMQLQFLWRPEMRTDVARSEMGAILGSSPFHVVSVLIGCAAASARTGWISDETGLEIATDLSYACARGDRQDHGDRSVGDLRIHLLSRNYGF